MARTANDRIADKRSRRIRNLLKVCLTGECDPSTVRLISSFADAWDFIPRIPHFLLYFLSNPFGRAVHFAGMRRSIQIRLPENPARHS